MVSSEWRMDFHSPFATRHSQTGEIQVDHVRPAPRPLPDFITRASALHSPKRWRTPMTTATLDAKTTDFDVDDIEYLRHGDTPLLARVFRPRGPGPFPALVECHGGAWCMSDRLTERPRHEFMASHGIVSIALDFRSGNTDPYPSSVQDIN